MLLIRLLQGGLLLVLTVAIHAIVLSGLLERFQKHYQADVPLSHLGYTWLLARIASVTVLAHLLEIGIWGGFYLWTKALPNAETSFYFSAVTFATIGYGDIVLPPSWRLVAAMEGLTGILMCGWSGALFYAVVSKLYLRTRSRAPK